EGAGCSAGALGDRERAARAAGRHVEGGRQPGTQGVGAAGDGRVEELGHLLVLLLGQGEPGGGDPALHVPPREVGGTRVNPNPRMKRPWVGIVFALFRIVWLILSAIFLYDLAVMTCQFDVMRAS